ncbi:MAG: pyridoxal phosphate-dependent aminotransferase [Candidatus Hodarchaeales archaeon]|jgi:aspartate/methionine/tyrosine aminotransferase
MLKEPLEILSTDELRKVCPLKWHNNIPKDGIALGIADIDFKGPKGLNQFLKKNLSENFSFYGPYEGLPSAIDTAEAFLKQIGFTEIQSKSIQVLPGTMIGIYTIMEWAYRKAKTGNLVMINPTYPPIHRHASQTGNKINWVDLDGEWRLDKNALMENINSTTKLLVLNNPDNPVGTVFNKEELKLIRDLSVDYDFTCFVDELYEPLVFNHSHIPLATLEGMKNRCITLYGFSKAYGLSGYRSGFIQIGSPDLKDIKYIIEQLLVSPSPFASLVMKYALTHPESIKWKLAFRDQMAVNTKLAAKKFQENNIDCKEPEGCFFVFPNIDVEDDVDFSNTLLSKYGVQVVPGSEFGPRGKGHIRINCATSPEWMLEGINRIIKALKDND